MTKEKFGLFLTRTKFDVRTVLFLLIEVLLFFSSFRNILLSAYLFLRPLESWIGIQIKTFTLLRQETMLSWTGFNHNHKEWTSQKENGISIWRNHYLLLSATLLSWWLPWNSLAWTKGSTFLMQSLSDGSSLSGTISCYTFAFWSRTWFASFDWASGL